MSPRPKRMRKVIHPPGFRGFKPFGSPESNGNDVKLLLEEFEAIKLADYEKLTQAVAAEKMEVSRPTFSRIYESARGKIAKAFMEASSIIVEGGNVESDIAWFHCMSCHTIFRLNNTEIRHTVCPVCGDSDVEQTNTPEASVIEKKQIADESRCICPKCDFGVVHVPGEPCRTKFCPNCNISLIRENSPYHKQLLKKIKNNKNQKKMRKIAIPLQNNMLCNHFGHSDEFTVFTTQDRSITNQKKLIPPPHEPGSIPRWLHEEGVTDVIAGGIGQRAIQILLKNNINVFAGVAPKATEELVKDLLMDNLQAGVNLCDH